MKLLYIANSRIPTEKAHGVQIMKMCEAFALVGADVELVIPWRFNPIKEDPFYYYGVKNIFKITKIPSVDLVRFGRIGFWVQSLSFAGLMSLYVMFKKADSIYSRDELSLFFLSFLKRDFLWEIHTNRWNFIIKRVVRKAVGIIAITEGLKVFLIENGCQREKIVVAHDGVDLKMFISQDTKSTLRKQHNIPESKKVIGHIGKLRTMGKKKGVEGLITIFAEVLKTIPEAFLLLVGPNKEELRAVTALLGNLNVSSDSYKVVTHIPQKDTPPFLQISDVLVMNYPAIEHYKYYMSPLKLFEYMASGTPIVTVDLPSIREILNENNAVIVEANNPEALRKGIIKVLNDSSLATTNANKALEDVRNYTWEKRAENIFNSMKINPKT